ncbi:hypothetical protein [Agarilytica rhodophyticola]|uniref:hypothetical protein n=1 Tax=Agarilytica rhodophyticola TaxID=1737490 RepID=UPI000B3458DF|nr:hypothetical protein [Agarilytica rhodophyticola]
MINKLKFYVETYQVEFSRARIFIFGLFIYFLSHAIFYSMPLSKPDELKKLSGLLLNIKKRERKDGYPGYELVMQGEKRVTLDLIIYRLKSKEIDFLTDKKIIVEYNPIFFGLYKRVYSVKIYGSHSFYIPYERMRDLHLERNKEVLNWQYVFMVVCVIAFLLVQMSLLFFRKSKTNEMLN